MRGSPVTPFEGELRKFSYQPQEISQTQLYATNVFKHVFERSRNLQMTCVYSLTDQSL